MYARLQSTQAPLPRNEDNAESATLITATISAHPGFRELYLMKQIGWGRGTMLSLWATQADAENTPPPGRGGSSGRRRIPDLQ